MPNETMTSAYNQRLSSLGDDIIISGSTWAAIWHMSWPLLVNMAIISLANFCDVWVAGQIGPQAQAAIGIGGQVWFFLVILVVALSAGTTAIVSRMWGEGNREATVQAARESIAYAFIFGAASAGTGLLFCRVLFHILGASSVVTSLGWDYLKYDLTAQFPYTVLWISNSIFRAKGNARAPMMIMSLVTFSCIALEIGLCIWPWRIGISGIGIAWLIAATGGTILSLFILSQSEIGPCLDWTLMLTNGFSKAGFWRLMKIGVPACVSDLSWVGGNFVLLLILAHTTDPTSCQASWAIGLKCEEILGSMPIYAFAMAVATIVGQNLGAGCPERAERAGWQVAFIGAGLNTVIGLSMLFGATPLAKLMSNNAAVVHFASQYFQIVSVSQPFVAFWLILFGAMQGAGYTRWPMLVTLFCLTILRLPLAWYLTDNLGMGPIGTWISLAVSSIIIGILAVWRFKSGVWKYQKV